MSTVHDQFVGAADETVYGTPVASDNFFEPKSEDFKGDYQRIESEAIRGPVLRADRWAPNPKGAAGGTEIDVLDKGFNFWLKHSLGDVDSTTTPGSFICTPGPLAGKSFTVQAARYASASDTLIPFTYAGGKVTEWELSAEIDGILTFKPTCDFASETIGEDEDVAATALASPAYPAGTQLMTFIGSSCTVGGDPFVVNSVSVTGNNGLKVDRYGMRGAATTSKREPKENDMKEFACTLGAEFEDTSMSERVAASLAAGAMAAVVLHFDSPQGGTLDVAFEAGRFDEGPANIERGVTAQSLTLKIVAPTDGSDALTLTYTPKA